MSYLSLYPFLRRDTLFTIRIYVEKTMIRKFQRVISVVLLTAALAIGFCTSSYAAGIPNTEWKLTSLNGSSPTGEFPITLKIDNGKVTGNGGCNSYFSIREVDFSGDDPNEIQIGGIASTKKLCYQEGINEQERKYLSALQYVTTYTTDGATLTLTNPEEKIDLKFSKA